MTLSQKDADFIRTLLGDELDYDSLVLLDEKLKDPNFRKAYERAIDEKYSAKENKILGYMPMIVLMVLIALGIFLIINK